MATPMEPWSDPQPRRGIIDLLNYCFPVGSLAGVRIGIHWLFPFFLVLVPLYEGREHGAEWGATVGLTIVFLFLPLQMLCL